ncbi:MAG: hypothetical protein BWY83_01499 [bacterium ADurb.Bin478]|nr:MAG: hypothetical protein BWY83_01499 [bacterium ADurb.Bin478]
MILDEKTNIVVQDAQVGERRQIMCKRSSVIPDPQPVADPGPSLDVLLEGAVRRIAAVQRFGKTAFNGAQANDHVRPRPHGFRRLARVLVGQGLDRLIRKLFFHRFGHPIDQMQQRRSLCALFFRQGAAGCALTIIIPVVLRDRKHERLRIPANGLEHLIGHQGDDIRIGAAKLRMIAQPLAVDLGEILRVLIKIPVRRRQRIERVHKHAFAEAYLAAVFLFEPARAAVHAVAAAPVAVKTVKDKGLTVLEQRYFSFIQILQDQPFQFGDAGNGRCVPAAVQVIFQQPVHAVQRTAYSAAGDDQTVSGGTQHIAFIPQLLERNTHAELLQTAVIAQKDLMGCGRFAVRANGQRHPGHLAKEMLQLFRRMAYRGGRLFSDDDHIVRAVFLYQNQSKT